MQGGSDLLQTLKLRVGTKNRQWCFQTIAHWRSFQRVGNVRVRHTEPVLEPKRNSAKRLVGGAARFIVCISPQYHLQWRNSQGVLYLWSWKTRRKEKEKVAQVFNTDFVLSIVHLLCVHATPSPSYTNSHVHTLIGAACPLSLSLSGYVTFPRPQRSEQKWVKVWCSQLF